MSKSAIRNEYTDYTIDKDISFMTPIYLSKICSVRNIDTDETIIINTSEKQVYSYLCGIGYNQGYNSIYPNLDQIAYNLGMTTRTVGRCIDKLKKAKLLSVKKIKQGRYESNHYWVYRPNMISRVQWLDVMGNPLIGKAYTFNRAQFTSKENGKDKLLSGLQTLINEQADSKVSEILGLKEGK